MKRLPTPAILCLTVGAALAVAAGGSTQSDAHEAEARTAGLRCAIVTRDLGGAVEISGKVTSDHAAHGTYDLRIRHSGGSGQAMIDQSGDFSVGKGRTATLGQATLGGRPSQYKADLVLTIDGQRLICRSASDSNEI